MRSRLPLLAIAAVLLATVGATLLGSWTTEPAAPTPEAPALRVAAAPDAESTLLAHVLVALLAAREVAGEVVVFGDARDTRQALERGDVDLHPAYTGEAWLEVLGRADPPGDPRTSYEEVRAHDADLGLVWFRPSFGDGIAAPPANATFSFVVPGPPSVDADLVTMSQLASRLSAQPEATLCVDPEFASRPDGLSAVLAAYSVRGDQPILVTDPEDAVAGVLAGECIAGLTTATDGRAWAAGLRPLVDDLEVFPAFLPLPQARRDALLQHPEASAAVRPMAAQLTTQLLGRWNAEVHRGRAVEEVAQEAAVELRRRAGLVLSPPPA
ncbi:MAG: glycine betaine ABC transporter substrate-binding protein [Nitriliruptoraceae bacterium]